MTVLTGSALTLTAISADRFMAVKHPLRQLHKHSGKFIALIWTVAVAASLPFLIFRKLVTVEVSFNVSSFSSLSIHSEKYSCAFQETILQYFSTYFKSFFQEDWKRKRTLIVDNNMPTEASGFFVR